MCAETENATTLDDVVPEVDPREQIERLREHTRKLIDENRTLRQQIRAMKAEAAAKKKMEFSKLIFMGVSALTLAITVFSCVMIWNTMDTSALAYLIPAVFTEMAAATGFYYTKAKVENKIKLMALHGVQPEASDFTTD